MKLAIAVVGLIVAALAVACGDSSDTLTLEEYFAELEAIDADIDAQFEEAFMALFPEGEDESFFADDANLPLVKEAIAAFPRITRDALDRVQDLDAPSEVEAEHDELVDALEDLRDAFTEGTEALDEAGTFTEFEAINDELDASRLTPAEERFAQACFDVVAVGEANGITVNVTCEDE